MDTSLKAVWNEDDSITTAIRLVQIDGHAHLFVSRDHGGRLALSLAALAEDTQAGAIKALPSAPRPLPDLAGIPGPPPEWDAMWHVDGSVSAVWTVAGSAVVHLGFRNTKEPGDVTVNSETPFGVFGMPYFVRDEGDSPDTIAAIASIGGGRPDVVVFRRQADGRFGKHVTVEAAWHGIPMEAKLVRAQDDYLVLVNVLQPGRAGGESPPRPTGTGGTIEAGILAGVQLNAELRMVGPVTSPCPSDLAYEVDAIPVGRDVAILATTRNGIVLSLPEARGPKSDKASAMRSEIRLDSAEPLSSPTLIRSGQSLYVAAIRGAGTNSAEVVATKLDLRAF